MPKIAKLAARVVIGSLFVGHGTQKLQGWFGGPGIEGMTAAMEGMGMHPPRRNAYAAGISETAGGALLAAGLATPLASAILTGTMTVAIAKVHAGKGPWVTGGGWEYNAVLIAAVLAIAEDGPGSLSLDHLLGIERSGPVYGLLAAALGAAAAYGTLEAARAATPQSDPSGAGPRG
ncbi:DoxX family protein [Nocardioides mangrovicus]|uniref:DoxX family protein n=1 Tax=Nocardioides mangrovicus TaxID=2478913 RepID=A0A3L8P0J2_9ACTN|nr:DoxX family protein [Nocardioides mangrovicus]RLV48313.1 DoxX family protein [Nocardioides mangrovicus]